MERTSSPRPSPRLSPRATGITGEMRFRRPPWEYAEPLLDKRLGARDAPVLRDRFHGTIPRRRDSNPIAHGRDVSEIFTTSEGFQPAPLAKLSREASEGVGCEIKAVSTQPGLTGEHLTLDGPKAFGGSEVTRIITTRLEDRARRGLEFETRLPGNGRSRLSRGRAPPVFQQGDDPAARQPLRGQFVGADPSRRDSNPLFHQSK